MPSKTKKLTTPQKTLPIPLISTTYSMLTLTPVFLILKDKPTTPLSSTALLFSESNKCS